MTAKRVKPTPQFALCIQSDDPDLLTPRMVYQVLADASAAKSGYVRAFDNEGEDYLSPAERFIAVDIPQAARRTLLKTKIPAMQGARPTRG